MGRAILNLSVILATALLLAVFAYYVVTSDRIPSEVLEALRSAEKYELISLEPEDSLPPEVKMTTGEMFHDWPVLGSVAIADEETRERLTAAFVQNAHLGERAIACWEPRHALRVTHAGRTFDLLICFQCEFVEVYVGGNLIHGFQINNSPQPVFDDVLRKANVKLAWPG